LSFHDWKSQGILLQKTCSNPEWYLYYIYYQNRTPSAETYEKVRKMRQKQAPN